MTTVAEGRDEMGDLISREAAMNAFERKEMYYGDTIADILAELPSVQPETAENGCISCMNAENMHDSPTDDCISRRKGLLSVQPQRWIPVTERLPEHNGDYLVTGRQGAVNKRRYEDGYWYGNWAVLAWMPLPEPYGADMRGTE